MIRSANRRPVRRAAAAFLLLTVFLLLITQAESAAAVTLHRMRFCLETLIPSLFGCMAAANLLTGTGAAAWLGCRMRFAARLLRIPPELLTVFLVSQIAGYPVGTLLLRRMAEQNRLTPQTAGRYACICFGGGPAFLVGFAGSRLFGSAAAGWMLLGSCIAANLILLLLMPKPPLPEPEPVTVRLTPQALPEAVSAAMHSLAAICGMVMLTGILMQLADAAGLTGLLMLTGSRLGIPAQTVRALTEAAADVTQLQTVFRCGMPFRMLLAISAALLSFGGFCVHLQCAALSGGMVSLRRLLGMRLSAAALAFSVIYVLSGFFTLSESIPALAHPAAVSHSGSLIPAILIFCTGFPFLIKKD